MKHPDSSRLVIVLKFEAAIGLDEGDIKGIIQSALDDLRGSGAARLTSYEIIDEAGYQEWYSHHGVSEIEIPVPTRFTVD